MGGSRKETWYLNKAKWPKKVENQQFGQRLGGQGWQNNQNDWQDQGGWYNQNNYNHDGYNHHNYWHDIYN